MRDFTLLMFTLLSVDALFGEELVLQAGTTVKFADEELSREVLTLRDEFVKALSPFDRQVRLMTDKDVSEATYLRFVGQQVTEWPAGDVEKVTRLIQSISDRLRSFKIPFPREVLLIRTTGREESNAAYCRRNAIVLPAAVLKRQPDRLERLLIHELFHVLSNQNESLRRRLYRIIGFEFCGAVPLPGTFQDRKLTNPDAPVFAYRVRLRNGDESGDYVPVLYSTHERYDTKTGGNLFQYLQFRLMRVEQVGERWRAKIVDGDPILVEPQKMLSYFERIGRNTKYIIHPDEILADNFVFLIMQSKSLATPRIIDDMKKVLTN